MKLVVEVIDAHYLMPKDEEGSSSAFVEIDSENQLSKTTTIPKNLNPFCYQKIFFNFNHNHSITEVPCSNIVKQGEEAYQVLLSS